MKAYQIGDKVVPLRKSIGIFSIDESSSWTRAKERGQKFLYVVGVVGEKKEYLILSDSKDMSYGDCFELSDVVPFTEIEVGEVECNNKENDLVFKIDKILKYVEELNNNVKELLPMNNKEDNNMKYPSNKIMRKEIVEQAIYDISCKKSTRRLPLYDPKFDKIKFITNIEKRTVVALLCEGNGFDDSYKITKRAKAKCMKEDDFNDYIGQVIAIYRLFDLEVPKEYLNVPNMG